MRNRILTFVTCSLLSFSTYAKHHEDPIVLFNQLPIKQSSMSRFLPVMQNNAQNTRQEKGNISFDVLQPASGSTTIYLFEQWKNQAALDKHMKTPHLKAVGDIVGDALELGKTERSDRLIKLSDDAEPDRPESGAFAQNVITFFNAKPDAVAEVKRILLNGVEKQRLATGNHRYDVYQFADKPQQLVVYEQWESMEAFKQSSETNGDTSIHSTLSQWLDKTASQSPLILKDVSQ